MRFFLGPMSKNVVDVVLEIAAESDKEWTFIPSRRQIECTGGYVNNWTTKAFSEYINAANLTNVLIERDHGGPGQGLEDDNGFESLSEDLKYFNIIHIDPWKKYPLYEDALAWTIKMIQFCCAQNDTVLFEVGTEEGIRPISTSELKRFLIDLESAVTSEQFRRIKYVVIQCGTKLLEKSNTGDFDADKLKEMLAIVNRFGFIAKEHNGDWVSKETVIQKEVLGLQNLNIAPQLGELETRVCLHAFKENPVHYEKFFQICHSSGKWKKWVSSKFDPYDDKDLLILICGHYVFSNPEFIEIKKEYQNLDTIIQSTIRLFIENL